MGEYLRKPATKEHAIANTVIALAAAVSSFFLAWEHRPTVVVPRATLCPPAVAPQVEVSAGHSASRTP